MNLRRLVVIADDFGIGPATSEGILELAEAGRITGAALLVNSPHAGRAIRLWRKAGAWLPVGWHVCLTLDRPILSHSLVPSLVGPEGRFLSLGGFLLRWLRGRLNRAEVAAELAAQYERFIDLVGRPPDFVNSHHHVHCFAPVGPALCELLSRQHPLPCLRRVREPWRTLAGIPGARCKRLVLSLLGRRAARYQENAGFPGNDWLAGITDPPCLDDPDFLLRWLRSIPGRVVELMCHPGLPDPTLPGRDGTPENGLLHRRPREMDLLRDDRFFATIRQAGFVLTSPAMRPYSRGRRVSHVV